ncbi:MAG: tetratricopeptide repeat protein, partial [Planctomycetota bacterium]
MSAEGMAMEIRGLTIGLLVLASSAAAQKAQIQATLGEQFLAQERAAFTLYEKKAWPDAVAAFEKQIALYADNPRPYYNIACVYALQGHADRAAVWLKLSIDHGWRNV